MSATAAAAVSARKNKTGTADVVATGKRVSWDRERDTTTTDNEPIFRPFFLSLMPSRLVYWDSRSSFDLGLLGPSPSDSSLPHRGQILLTGHSGIGGLSPAELLSIPSPVDRERTTVVFGKGDDAVMRRIVVMFETRGEREWVEGMVEEEAGRGG